MNNRIYMLLKGYYYKLNKIKIKNNANFGNDQGLEADVSCQEEEEEEKEAVWLREQGHCKMRSVQDHPFQESTIGCSSDRQGRLPGLLWDAGEELFVVWGGKRLMWVAGQGKRRV